MLNYIILIWLGFFTFMNHSQEAPSQAPSQEEIELSEDIWRLLLKVKYSYNKNYYIPKFDEKIKALDGKIITVRGFMYPLDETIQHEFFMLSYYPINICFFCGGAGPESVIEVNAKKPIRLKEKPLTLRGKLKLNYHDKERLFFILLGAEVVP